MVPLPLNVQTLIADLTQSVQSESLRAASVHFKKVKNREYAYVREKIGMKFHDRLLGPISDPAVVALAEEARSSGMRARERRKLVTLIKRVGVPAPTPDIAHLIVALSEARLFDKGLVLVGTGAYQIYPCVVGAILASGSLATQDLDLAVATIAIESDQPLLEVLRVADPSFKPVPGLDRLDLPKKFITDSGFSVEVLTPVRSRADRSVTPVRGLQAGAVPLQFLNYLIEDAAPAVALIESGATVRVPLPARYAVHKLIVAQRRQSGSLKRSKDLKQAAELIDALSRSEPYAIDDALADAEERGPQWRKLISASLQEIGRPRAP